MDVLVLKTGALGDVLRTTSILPGLAARHPDARVTWLTAEAARPLVERHRLVDEVTAVDPDDPRSVDAAAERLGGRRWDWVLSFDDEEPLCRLASSLDARRVSGALLGPDGARRYTDDVAPWFDMGLLSRYGKAEADRRKLANRRSHPQIHASMLGIAMGKPELPLEAGSRAAVRERVEGGARPAGSLLVGLNTGAGGRWTSKGIPIDRTVAFATGLAGSLDRPCAFLVLGGPGEAERNAAILAGLADAGLHAIDGRPDNDLATFAALVDACDLLLTSDSMALHVAVARDVPIVAFFAPTSAAEIELYGLGEKVVSTAPDYCSYRPDADNASITPERLVEAARRVLADRVTRAE